MVMAAVLPLPGWFPAAGACHCRPRGAAGNRPVARLARRACPHRRHLCIPYGARAILLGSSAAPPHTWPLGVHVGAELGAYRLLGNLLPDSILTFQDLCGT
jgi:hypothetical protein